jgi:hypothetical protein
MKRPEVCCKPVYWACPCWRPASWLRYPPTRRPSWAAPDPDGRGKGRQRRRLDRPWEPLSKNAGSVDSKGFLSDPFGSEKPLFTITAQNVEQYKDKLSPGQWRCSSATRTPSRCRCTRPIAAPPCRMTCSPRSRKRHQTTLVAGGNGLENFQTAVPFPIPKAAWR